MKLRSKILLPIGLLIVASIVLCYPLSHTIILDQVNTLEKDSVTLNVNYIHGVFSDKVESLQRYDMDWAGWDDSYTFVNDLNQEYINDNLVDETFIGTGISVFAYFNASGDLVYGKAMDLNEEREVGVPDFMKKLKSDDILIKFSGLEDHTSGFISTPKGLMFVSSYPITTSLKKGPIRGALVMGSYINSSELQQIDERFNTSIKLYNLYDFLNSGLQMPSDVQNAYNHLMASNESIEIVPTSPTVVTGYSLIRDLYGKPAAIMKLDVKRDIYLEGTRSLNYFLDALLLTALLFGMLSASLLETFVISKINRLSNDVNKLGLRGDPGARLPVEKRKDDEFAKLARDINAMLSALQKRRKNKRR